MSLITFSKNPEETAERGDGGAVERWRMGIGTVEQLVSRQSVVEYKDIELLMSAGRWL